MMMREVARGESVVNFVSSGLELLLERHRGDRDFPVLLRWIQDTENQFLRNASGVPFKQDHTKSALGFFESRDMVSRRLMEELVTIYGGIDSENQFDTHDTRSKWDGQRRVFQTYFAGLELDAYCHAHRDKYAAGNETKYTGYDLRISTGSELAEQMQPTLIPSLGRLSTQTGTAKFQTPIAVR